MNQIKQVSEEKGVALAALCDSLQISRTTLYRNHEKRDTVNPSQKPHNALEDKQKQQILDLLHSERFIDSTPYDVFYTLLDEEQYVASIRTMYRILFQAGDSHERRNLRHHRDAIKPELIATAPNEVWSWDITKLLSVKRFVYFHLYVILDIFSRYVVGWMIADRECQHLAKQLIQKTILRYGIQPGQLTLHSDNGPSMTTASERGYYGLSTDIYLVSGYKRHCLYDLKQGKLYSVSQQLKKFLIKIANEVNSIDQYSPQETQFFTNLQNGLIRFSKEKPISNDILTLKEDVKPNFAWIEVTKQCNLNCEFCYENASCNNYSTMSLDDFLLAIHELAINGIHNIQLIGGEPLLLKAELKKMLTESSKLFNTITLFTNGTLINKDWCQFFKNNKISVAISIHSYLEEEHDRVTKIKGSFNRATAAIKMLQKYGVTFRVATVKTKNVHIGSPSSIKNSKFTLKPDLVRLTGRANIDLYDFEMFKQKAITKEKMGWKLKKTLVKKNINGHKCFASLLYISSNLDVYPCVMERRLVHGNLKKNKLGTILNKNILHLTKDYIDDCKVCEYRYACFDCRPDANGSHPYAKPWYCSYDPYQGRWLNLKQLFKTLKKR